MPRQLCLLFVVSFVMLLNSSAEAEEKKIGVAVSAVFNTSAETGQEVSANLGAALAEMFEADVIAGPDAQARLPATARSETCLGDSACLVDAGRALGVDELLMLVIVGSGESLKIEATWVDITSGKTALRQAIDAPRSPEAMGREFAAQARVLLPDLPLRARSTNAKSDPDASALSTSGSGETVQTVQIGQTPSTGGHKMSSVGNALLIGGAAALAGSLGYGTYRIVDCGLGYRVGCDPASDSVNLDAVSDVVGGLGLVSLSIATYLFYSSDDTEMEMESPVALSLSGEAVGISLGGQF